MKPFRLFLPVVCLLATGALAQQSPPADPNFYKLDFVIKELDAGKVVNSRNYSSIQGASGKERSSIRTGNRVPVPSGEKGFQFIDVGVSIDFDQLRELPGDRLAVWVVVDISSNAPSETAGLPPIIRQNKWNSVVMLPVRKATTIFTSDDPTSKRQVQIEMTATPLK